MHDIFAKQWVIDQPCLKTYPLRKFCWNSCTIFRLLSYATDRQTNKPKQEHNLLCIRYEFQAVRFNTNSLISFIYSNSLYLRRRLTWIWRLLLLLLLLLRVWRILWRSVHFRKLVRSKPHTHPALCIWSPRGIVSHILLHLQVTTKLHEYTIRNVTYWRRESKKLVWVVRAANMQLPSLRVHILMPITSVGASLNEPPPKKGRNFSSIFNDHF